MTETAGQQMSRERRNILILEMVEGGRKYAEVKRALAAAGVKISEKQVGKIVRDELNKVAGQRRDLGERIFDQKLSQLDRIIAANWGILTTACTRCNGRGHIGQDPDREPGVMAICDRCKGDTKQFPARDRAAASKEVRQAIAEQCKLLGLYAPEKFAWTDTDGNDVDFHDELRDMDIEDLDRDFAIYQAAVADERKRRQREETAANGPS